MSEHEGYDTLGLTCIYEEELDEDDFFDVSVYREELQDNLAEQCRHREDNRKQWIKPVE